MLARYKIKIQCEVDYAPDKAPRIETLWGDLHDEVGVFFQEEQPPLPRPLYIVDPEIEIERELVETIEDEIEERKFFDRLHDKVCNK